MRTTNAIHVQAKTVALGKVGEKTEEKTEDTVIMRTPTPGKKPNPSN